SETYRKLDVDANYFIQNSDYLFDPYSLTAAPEEIYRSPVRPNPSIDKLEQWKAFVDYTIKDLSQNHLAVIKNYEDIAYYYKSKESDTCLEYYLRPLKIRLEYCCSTNVRSLFTAGTIDICTNIASIYLQNNNFIKAIEYLTQAIDSYNNANYVNKVIYSLTLDNVYISRVRKFYNQIAYLYGVNGYRSIRQLWFDKLLDFTVKHYGFDIIKNEKLFIKALYEEYKYALKSALYEDKDDDDELTFREKIDKENNPHDYRIDSDTYWNYGGYEAAIRWFKNHVGYPKRRLTLKSSRDVVADDSYSANHFLK
ncbi:unnamed protein product, partial [Didymodactylos carnosus]